MFNPARPNTIFIQLASYRDTELPLTIKSAIEAADHPELLSFGVVHQYGPETLHLLDEFRGRPGFRMAELPWQESRGVGVARNMANELYRGEEWTLQVDSHTHFEPGWDTDLIRQWQACGDDKAVLSAYPPGYKRNEHGEIALKNTGRISVKMYASKFFYRHIPVFESMAMERNDNTEMLRSPYCSGGFVFGHGKVIVNVPYVKEIAFIGEEIVRSVQLYTHGYNVYLPIGLRLYHSYGGSTRHSFWKDMRDSNDKVMISVYDSMIKASYDLADNILLGRNESRLGKSRTLDEFALYSGIDFRLKRLSANQRRKLEPPYEESLDWVFTERAKEKI